MYLWKQPDIPSESRLVGQEGWGGSVGETRTCPYLSHKAVFQVSCSQGFHGFLVNPQRSSNVLVCPSVEDTCRLVSQEC